MSTLGMYRHLSQCATANGHFVVLAIDHRGILRTALDSAAGQPISDGDFVEFKLQVMEALMGEASAVLIDPDFGMVQGISTGRIRGGHGLLAPLEVTDYDVHPSQRDLRMIEGWGVEAIKQAGCSGAKLLLYYHPKAESTPAKLALVEATIAACNAQHIPLFLEPIVYSLDPEETLTSAERRQISVEAAKTFSAMGAHVLKLEFPAEASASEQEWIDAAGELNAACGATPWALLSAGANFETFVRQAEIACRAGCSGVIVGRSVWNEAVTTHGEARTVFLRNTARRRFHQLATLCAQYATDWRTKVAAPTPAVGWYLSD